MKEQRERHLPPPPATTQAAHSRSLLLLPSDHTWYCAPHVQLHQSQLPIEFKLSMIVQTSSLLGWAAQYQRPRVPSSIDRPQVQVSGNSSSAGTASAKGDFGAIKYAPEKLSCGTHVLAAEELNWISDFHFHGISTKQVAIIRKGTSVSHG